MRLGIVALAAIAFTAASPVRADGAFPDEFSIHSPANAPHRILMGANFGLLVSEDDGLTWRYSCEPWVVAGSNAALAFANVSLYQVTADGAVLADSFDIRNITRSADVACTWPSATGSTAGQLVSDFFPDPNDANFVLAIVLTISSGSYIVASHDGGKTFDAPHLYDTPDLLTGVEIARSKPGVVYATSVSISGGPAKLIASADSGATWSPKTLPIPAGTEPRILAVDPADEKTVYLRLLTGAISDAIAITPDGGQTLKIVLQIDDSFSSFLRAGDGALYAGTRTGKLYVRPAGQTSFNPPRDALHLRCLGQRPNTKRIYACSDMVVDGSSLSSSDDNGATFQPVMSFTQLLGPLACTPVQENCQAHWDRIQGVLGIRPPDAGQADGGGGSPGSSGGSHCASAAGDAWSIWLLAAFMRRRRTRARPLGPR